MSQGTGLKVSFNLEKLTQILHAKLYEEVSLERFREIKGKVKNVPEMIKNLGKYHAGREESLRIAFRHGKAWREFVGREKLNKDEQRLCLVYFSEATSFILHYDLFLSSLFIQSSQEQREKWVDKCERLEYFGSYAQTELGHGSNVRGIEIEARYDHQTKQFTFNSPTITATKWWIGGLGLCSTHTLLVANLIISKTNYGPHAFFIQIRDLTTHNPLPGITVGDIGPKLGLNGMDNGFLRFSNFEQPKDSMLNRFAKINDSGEYEIIDPNAIKILYLSLIKARCSLVFDAFYQMAQALHISLRYSLTREQFADPDDPSKERRILEYQSQKFKLFRVLARLYCQVFARHWLKSLYKVAENRLENGDDSQLAYLHCIVSLYKSYFSFVTVDSVEECRRACGGHGFLMTSGLPSIYQDFLPSITYDGDNSILILQSARFYMAAMRKGKDVHENLLYLHNNKQVLEGEPHSADFHQKCFETAARQRFQRLLIKEQTLLGQGKSKHVIWNQDLQLRAVEACEAAFYVSVHQIFSQSISEISDVGIRNAVEVLRQVFAVSELEKFHGELIRAGVTGETLDKMKTVQLEGLEKIRPDALGLIGAFEITNESVNSVIAGTDGMVYRDMLKVSKELNPLNKNQVFTDIRKHLSPKL